MKTAVFLAFLFLQTAAPRTSAIQGTVRRGDNADNAPLSNARVELFSGPDAPIVARSDGAGRFVFNNLAAGVYHMRVTRDGYLRQEYGARAFDMPGAPIRVTAGQRVTDIDFRLSPASILSGTVTDNHGEPLPDVLVQASRPGYDPRGNPILRPLFFALTDDLGRYRLFWIDPGDYIVSATATPDISEILAAPPNVNRTRAQQGFVPTYHTGVSDPVGIEPLHVGTGVELDGLDFRLTRNPHVKVSGNVLGADGAEAVKSSISLAPSIPVTTAPLRRLTAQEHGRFDIAGVTPGRYLVSARSVSGERGVVPLDIGVFPVDGVNISLQPPAPVIGQVYLDSSSTALDFGQVRVSMIPLNADLAAPIAVGIQPDGKFAMERVETGAYLLDVSGMPGNAYMAAARIGDLDVLQKDVTINGVSANPLEILVRVDGGSLGGTINDSAGKPAAGAMMVLVPDAGRRRPDQYRAAFADERGRFSLRGIPPGEYTAYAWDRIEPYAFLNSDFMARFAEAAIPLRIEPGVNPDTNLRVINSAR